MKYQIVLKDRRRLVVLMPGACRAVGPRATEEEALENIQDAIQEYLAAVAGRDH
jgi:predicted RNase H-like HicB family nuclease